MFSHVLLGDKYSMHSVLVDRTYDFVLCGLFTNGATKCTITCFLNSKEFQEQKYSLLLSPRISPGQFTKHMRYMENQDITRPEYYVCQIPCKDGVLSVTLTKKKTRKGA